MFSTGQGRAALLFSEFPAAPNPALLYDVSPCNLPPRISATGNVLLVKGAAECVLERCDRVMLPDGKVVPLSSTCREAVLAAVDTMAGEALRILALAKKTDMPPDLAGWNGDSHAPAGKKLLDTNCYSEVESGLVFLGLMGLQDPPRPEVPDAIEDCRKAGIRVIVITGGRGDQGAEAAVRQLQEGLS